MANQTSRSLIAIGAALFLTGIPRTFEIGEMSQATMTLLSMPAGLTTIGLGLIAARGRRATLAGIAFLAAVAFLIPAFDHYAIAIPFAGAAIGSLILSLGRDIDGTTRSALIASAIAGTVVAIAFGPLLAGALPPGDIATAVLSVVVAAGPLFVAVSPASEASEPTGLPFATAAASLR